MKFLIGLTTGLILAWGTPKLIAHALDDIPAMPIDYEGPKIRTWKDGIEQ